MEMKMTLAIGRTGRFRGSLMDRNTTGRPARAGGFTLVEILLVLALLGLLAGLFIGAAGSLFGGRSAHGKDVFLEAVLAARSRAVAMDVPVRLRVAEDGRSLTVESTGATQIFDLTGGASVRITQVGLLAEPGRPGGSVAEVVPRGIRFFPDGTCDAFQVELRSPSGPPTKLAVDPWTCAEWPTTAERS